MTLMVTVRSVSIKYRKNNLVTIVVNNFHVGKTLKGLHILANMTFQTSTCTYGVHYSAYMSGFS